jgi:hypothetical protein
MNTENKNYLEYKKQLATYSECIKPMLEQASEALVNNTLSEGFSFNFEEHCVEEKRKLIDFRNVLKGGFK